MQPQRKERLFFNFKPPKNQTFKRVYAPADGVAKYLSKTFGVFAGPPHGGEFAMNFILHVLVLFTVLTMLFVAVIVPLESKAITKELNHACNAAIDTGFVEVRRRLAALTPKKRQAAVAGLKASIPKLEQLATQYATPDTTTVESNKKTMGVAYGIIAVLAATLVVFISVMAGAGVRVRTPVFQVFMENLVVFAFVGGAEALFFLKVASKFIPIAPSSLGATVLKALKTEFPAAAPAGGAPSPATTISVT